eukprot:9270417-Pyramimonas_sp.AAC.1
MFDTKALQDESVQRQYISHFVGEWQKQPAQTSLDEHAAAVSRCMLESAAACIPAQQASRLRPWISDRTLHLIDERNTARQRGMAISTTPERQLNRMIRQSAKADKNRWLTEGIESNGWDMIKSLRKGRAHKCGRLRDADGRLVDSSERADTMADYLEQVQWRPPPGGSHFADFNAEGGHLPIELGPITAEEVKRAVKHLRIQRAAGTDGVPPELWRALWDDDAALDILTALGS